MTSSETAAVCGLLSRLLSDLSAVRQHHEFTRDRIGQPGCPVRLKAAEFVETIKQAEAALQQEGA